jgi:hypothetical protein
MDPHVAAWLANDDLFRAQLATGRYWENIVARHLVEQGIPVQVTEKDVRPDVADRAAYRDPGDLVLPDGRIIDVKSRGFAFGDEPETFPYPTAIVSTLYDWMAKDQVPIAIVLISQKTRSMLVASTRTKDRWRIEQCWDRVRDCRRKNYACPRDLLHPMSTLVEFLRAPQPRTVPTGR